MGGRTKGLSPTKAGRGSMLLTALAAFVCALLMMAAVAATPAHAASITINSGATSGTDNTKHTAYKILDATSTGEGEDETFSYTIAKNSPWLSVLWDVDGNKAAEGQNWLTVSAISGDDSKYSVTLNDGVENNEATAKALAAYLNGKVPEDATKITLSSGSATDVDEGYYLVQSSLGSVLVLATTDITVNEKNSYPTLTKTADKTSMETGSKITYTITVTVPASATRGATITVHDTLDSPLAYQDDVKATFAGSDVQLTDATPKTGETWAKSFTITDAMLSSQTPEVVFTYTAELPSTAAADTAYNNKAYLNYADYETSPVSTTVKTYDFDLTKSFAGSASDTLQAQFQLRKNATESKTAYEFVKDDTGYVIADTDDTGKSTSFITVNNTKLNIRGLAEGTYYLVETETASGYNILTDAITVNVAADGTVTLTIGESTSTNEINVQNQRGATLPSTGGMGTTILYIVGGALVVVAAVTLVVRRRMQH